MVDWRVGKNDNLFCARGGVGEKACPCLFKMLTLRKYLEQVLKENGRK
jgi:hypothetical protein